MVADRCAFGEHAVGALADSSLHPVSVLLSVKHIGSLPGVYAHAMMYSSHRFEGQALCTVLLQYNPQQLPCSTMYGGGLTQ